MTTFDDRFAQAGTAPPADVPGLAPAAGAGPARSRHRRRRAAPAHDPKAPGRWPVAAGLLTLPAVGLAAAAAAVALAAAAALAAMADGLTGTLDAAGVPAARDVHTLAVVPRESSARNDLLEPLFVEGLTARGFAVDPVAPVRLTFGARQESVAAPHYPFSVAGRAGSNSRARVWLQVPLPEDDRPDTDRPDAPGTPLQLWVTVGRAGAMPLWQAALSARIPPPLPADIDRRMVDTLLAHWGETAHAEAVPIN